jgi:hypothetical protein
MGRPVNKAPGRVGGTAASPRLNNHPGKELGVIHCSWHVPRLFLCQRTGSNPGCLAVIDEISIELQAKDAKANHLRSWRVEAGPDPIRCLGHKGAVRSHRCGRPSARLPFWIGGRGSIFRARQAAPPWDRKAADRRSIPCDRGIAGCPTAFVTDGPDGTITTGADRHDG